MLTGDDKPDHAVRCMQTLRPVLFDFCVRMTGDLIASAAIVAKVCQEFMASHSEVHDGVPSNIRATLFRECRLMAGESWYAETAFLQNPGIEDSRSETLYPDPRTGKSGSDLGRLHELLRGLPGRRREALLLVERYDFSPIEAADIGGLGMTEFDKELAAAWQILLTSLPPGSVPVTKPGIPGPIKQIPLFSDPTTSENEPVTNLAEIMDELDHARRFAGFGWLGWIWFLIVAGIVIWYFWF